MKLHRSCFTFIIHLICLALFQCQAHALEPGAPPFHERLSQLKALEKKEGLTTNTKVSALSYLANVATLLEEHLAETGFSSDLPRESILNSAPTLNTTDETRSAPALSEFETHNIWINWLIGTPEEHEIYLFHEFMHLVFYDRNPFSHDNLFARLDSEVFAWKKTMQLIELYEKHKIMPIPITFTKIRSSIQTFEMRPWVEMVFESNFIP